MTSFLEKMNIKITEVMNPKQRAKETRAQLRKHVINVLALILLVAGIYNAAEYKWQEGIICLILLLIIGILVTISNSFDKKQNSNP